MAMRWYSVSVFSNFEKKVAENIKEMVEQKNLEDEVSEVLVPTEEVLEIRRGKKVQRERRFMPGYVLVKKCNLVAFSSHKPCIKIGRKLASYQIPQVLNSIDIR